VSIPTAAPVPTLVDPAKLRDWSRDLVAYLMRHLPQFLWLESRIVLANGGNNNVNCKGGNVVHVTGPTGAFTITGFAGGVPGKQIIVHNFSSGTMTLANQSASSAVGNRITTFTGADATGVSVAILVWDNASQSWLMCTGGAGGVGPPGPPGAPGDAGPHFIFSTQDSGQTHDIGYIVGTHHMIPGAFGAGYTFAAPKQIGCWPHFETRGGLLRNINTEIQITAGAGLKVYRVLIYKADIAGSIYPGSKFYESADIANNTGGIKTVSASMPTLAANTLYWFAIEDADGLAGYRSLTTAGITVGIQLDGAISTLTGFVRGFLQTLGAYGATPNPWGNTLNYEGNTQYPCVVITYAS